MAGARALWRAAGMKPEQMGRPVVAVANSFTQFVPGHTHLHEAGQIVKAEVERLGCYAAEFNTIAVDDGIAMGHDGMLYSLPSRELIADSVECMVRAHRADALVCISNCDKVTPGMLMAAMRLNVPTVFVSGGPMEAGRWRGRRADLITAMVAGADPSVTDGELADLEAHACPGCGSCSGMFTANSMNCLTEALGLALPGGGTLPATHAGRRRPGPVGRKLPVLEDGALGGFEEGEVHPLPGQGGPVHVSLIGGHIHAEELPLLRVHLVGQKDEPPPAQQPQSRQPGGGQKKKRQEQPSQRPQNPFQSASPVTMIARPARQDGESLPEPLRARRPPIPPAGRPAWRAP